MGKSGEISRNEHVQCGWCFKSSSLGEWNDLTYSYCYNRERKRSFTPLSEKRAFLRKTDAYYICPLCKMWQIGSNLSIVDTENEALKKLGGESIFKVVKQNKD